MEIEKEQSQKVTIHQNTRELQKVYGKLILKAYFDVKKKPLKSMQLFYNIQGYITYMTICNIQALYKHKLYIGVI